MGEGASKDIASELTQASRCCVAVPQLPVRVAPPALCLACREAHTRRSPAGLEGDNRCRGAGFDAHLWFGVECLGLSVQGLVLSV